MGIEPLVAEECVWKTKQRPNLKRGLFKPLSFCVRGYWNRSQVEMSFSTCYRHMETTLRQTKSVGAQ